MGSAGIGDPLQLNQTHTCVAVFLLPLFRYEVIRLDVNAVFVPNDHIWRSKREYAVVLVICDAQEKNTGFGVLTEEGVTPDGVVVPQV